jgi:uncharacterized protein YggE
MRRIAHRAALVLVTLVSSIAAAQDNPPGPHHPPPAQRPAPTVTVSGESEVSMAPDRAVLRFGSVSRADTAAAAQDSVNTAMQRVIEAIRGLNVSEKSITTSGITLSPYYVNEAQAPGRDREPRIAGFEARNTITVTLDDVSRVGPVLDAAIKAGANEVQSVSFELKDDTEARSRALRQAVQNAKLKADAIAGGMGMRVGSVVEAAESGTQPIHPMVLGRAAMEVAGAPVQPGQVQVRGGVTIVYALSAAERQMP